jgi:hypothetical protein
MIHFNITIFDREKSNINNYYNNWYYKGEILKQTLKLTIMNFTKRQTISAKKSGKR